MAHPRVRTIIKLRKLVAYLHIHTDEACIRKHKPHLAHFTLDTAKQLLWQTVKTPKNVA